MSKKQMRFTTMHYVSRIPRKPLPDGRVLVHNGIVPQRQFGMNGFRAWTQDIDSTPLLEVCNCNWAGLDLRGLVHYQVTKAAA